MSLPYVVVGIAGITNGGKTSLCQFLQKAYPKSHCINMDDYYVEEDSECLNMVAIENGIEHPNYEELDAVDFKQLTEDAERWMDEAKSATRANENHTLPTILLLEGILIYNHQPLVHHYNLKYFLTLSKEECWNRRKYREYYPPDPPGYFDAVVWPMYEKNLAGISDQNDIVYLDGADKQESIFERVKKDIDQLLQVQNGPR